jgi:hypothetical protein
VCRAGQLRPVSESRQAGWPITLRNPPQPELLQPDGNIRWWVDEQQTGLSYHADQGVIINRERVPRTPNEEFDESFD